MSSSSCPSWCQHDEIDYDDGLDTLIIEHQGVLAQGGSVVVSIFSCDDGPPEVVLKTAARPRDEISFDISELAEVASALARAVSQLQS